MQYEFVTKPEALSAIAEDVRRADVIGLDLETTSLDPRFGRIRLVQLHLPARIVVIDFFETKTLEPVLLAMRETKATWAIHNAKFEQKWFWWHYRLRLWPIFCTFRASALLHNGIKGFAHDLDSVVRRDLSENPTHVGQGGSNWAGVLTQEQKDNAAEDVLRLPRLYKVLREQLATYGLLQTALIEFGVILAEEAHT
jgi:ribonuclease D